MADGARQALRWLGQAGVYLAIAAILGLFASWPSYTRLPAEQALIKLSLVHGGEPKEACRRPSAEELAEQAANMRRALICPRERVPVRLELRLDGQVLYADNLPPSGIAGDGPSRLYRRFTVPAGHHSLFLGLNDSGGETGFDYQNAFELELEPGQSLAVSFRAETGGFSVR